ncbi:SprT-like domain-containing protein [Hydromonas duriensis]|uniref:SprT-like family protein n=1 Tax=Hydromonas duriensis TaxID=1527608 RepID=A0A4R6Y4X2_9BURK|nr:SprT-like domain-containing protein [Hydromonas duriensis]TDR30239.1 SprT-like family protein [Hydromonas duriensis]
MASTNTTPTKQAYDELQWAYDTFKQKLFGGQLPYCLITLQREKNTCGYFSAKRFANQSGVVTDEIAINPSYFAVSPLIEIMQTLVHEMVHLWQFHFGKPGRGRYHNKEWADKMERIGLMPSSTGQPGGAKTGDSMADYAIEGGLFLKTCAGLLDEHFKLSWYDRFPPSVAVVSGQNCYANQLQGLPNEATLLIANNSNAMVEPRPQPQTIHEPTDVKQTRVKYTCDCDINIWAKPNIQVRCCECNGMFEMQL